METMLDTLIVGGSYAGMAAAMALGRAMRNVLIIDSGKPCNAQTPYSHNFLTQDGNTPAAIARVAREQVLGYPTVRIRDGEVVGITGANLGFHVGLKSGEQISARKIVLATGLKDQLPAIDGLAACWGISAIHCPYCHGYEYRNKPTGLLINGSTAFEKARRIRQWTKQLTLLTDGPASIEDEHRRQLAALEIPVEESPIERIAHQQGYLSHVVLRNGHELPLNALYVSAPVVQHSRLSESAGCTLTQSGHIQVDSFQRTTVAGIFAAGDNASLFRSIAVAVATGTVAGAFINHELITEGY